MILGPMYPHDYLNIRALPILELCDATACSDFFNSLLVLLSHKIRDRVLIWIVTARCSISAHLHPGSGGRDGRRIERGEWSAIWGLCRGARRGAGPCRSTAADRAM